MKAPNHVSELDELRSILVGSQPVEMYQSALAAFGLPTPLRLGEIDATRLHAAGPVEVEECSKEDQVAVVGAGIRLADLSKELSKQGMTIPVGPAHPDWTLGESLALNLPHGLDAQYGGWRDWVLGLEIILADGTSARLGSKAVKNVAGYDAHKLFIGARGTLGVLWRVVLRIYPKSYVKDGAWQSATCFSPTLEGGGYIHRVLPSDFDSALVAAGDGILARDPASSTLWMKSAPRRFPGDWVLGAHQGWNNLRIENPAARRLMVRACDEFDPGRKLNPGEFGLEDHGES